MTKLIFVELTKNVESVVVLCDGDLLYQLIFVSDGFSFFFTKTCTKNFQKVTQN